MKTLIIWELVPEETNLYLVNHFDPKFLACANQFIGTDTPEEDLLCELSELLGKCEKLDTSEPIDLRHMLVPVDNIIICGCIM